MCPVHRITEWFALETSEDAWARGSCFTALCQSVHICLTQRKLPFLEQLNFPLPHNFTKGIASVI